MSRAVPVAAGATDVQGYTGSGCLVGVAIRETGTAIGHVQFRDGTSAAGAVVAVASCAQNGAVYMPVPAVNFETGIYLDKTGTGVTEVVLYLL